MCQPLLQALGLGSEQNTQVISPLTQLTAWEQAVSTLSVTSVSDDRQRLGEERNGEWRTEVALGVGRLGVYVVIKAGLAAR